MKKIEKISENANYTAINIGRMDEVKDYSMVHPKNGQTVRGKVFIKEAVKATGIEMSFSTIPPHAELPYFHRHVKDEEVYVILKGAGYYQVDDDCFPIKEGSLIRVAPEGIRGLCNTSDDPMVYICIQSKENSLEEHSSDDGERVETEPKWKLVR